VELTLLGRTAVTIHRHTASRCARRFTAADVSVGYALLLGQHIGLEPSFKPAVRAHWDRLQGREGSVRALAAQERAAIEQAVPTTHVATACCCTKRYGVVCSGRRRS